jgi:hypothetical protein
MREIVRNDMTETIPEVQEEDKRLVWNGLHVWQKVRLVSRTLAVEEEITDGELTGTPDYVGITGEDELIILDWKSGYVDRDYSDQLKGYVFLAAKKYCPDKFTGARIITVWLQSRDLYDVEIVTPDQYIAWLERLNEALVSQNFAPGGHCLFCPGQWTCAARTAMVRQAAEIFIDHATNNLPVNIGQLIAAYPKLQVVEAAIKRVRELIREGVESAGGYVPLADGRVLTLETQERRAIRLRSETLKILQEHFQIADAETLVDAFTSVFVINKEKLENEIKAAAPPRKGAANIRAILDALDGAGMVEKTEVKKLVIKKGRGDVDKK